MTSGSRKRDIWGTERAREWDIERYLGGQRERESGRLREGGEREERRARERWGSEGGREGGKQSEVGLQTGITGGDRYT